MVSHYYKHGRQWWIQNHCISFGNPSKYLIYFDQTYSSPYLEYYDEFVQISYLDQMPNNKKAWHIHQLVGKHPDNYCKYVFAYEFHINVFENSKYGDEYAGILYRFKCFKYFEGLLKDMRQFYIHRGLPWRLAS
jgi:hypothetical protein